MSAVKLLRDRTWTGQGGLAVHGPADLSCNDMAQIMAQVLGKPVRFQEVPGPGYKASLMKHGSSEASLHAKAFSFDRRVGFVGSYNLDPRSSRLNTEMGVIIHNTELAQQETSRFEGVYGDAEVLAVSADGRLLAS